MDSQTLRMQLAETESNLARVTEELRGAREEIRDLEYCVLKLTEGKEDTP